MSEWYASFLSYEILEVGMQRIDIGYVFSIFCLVITFCKDNWSEMVFSAELPDRQRAIRYDLTLIVKPVDMWLIFDWRFSTISWDKKKDPSIFICSCRYTDLRILVKKDIHFGIFMAALYWPRCDFKSLEVDIEKCRIQLYFSFKSQTLRIFKGFIELVAQIETGSDR